MINLYNYQLLQNFMDKSISYIISFINQRLYGIKMDLHLSRNLTCMCRQIVSTTISSAVYTSTCFSGSSVFFPSCSSKKLPHNIPQMLVYPVPWCGLRVFYFEIEPVKQMKITHDQLMINFMPHNFRHYSIAQPTVA